MHGFGKNIVNKFVQITPKTTLVVTPEMQQEMDRQQREERRTVMWGILAFSTLFFFVLGLIILCLSLTLRP